MGDVIELHDRPYLKCRVCGTELMAISKDSPEEYQFCKSHSQHHKENAEMATATTDKKAASKKYQPPMPSTGKDQPVKGARKMHKPVAVPKVEKKKGTVEKPINWLYEEIPSEDGIAIEKLQAMFAIRQYSDATKNAQLYRAKNCGDFVVVDNVIRLKKSVAEAREKAEAKAKEERIAKQMEKDAAKEKEKEAVAAAKQKEQDAIAKARAEEKAAKEKPAAK